MAMSAMVSLERIDDFRDFFFMWPQSLAVVWMKHYPEIGEVQKGFVVEAAKGVGQNCVPPSVPNPHLIRHVFGAITPDVIPRNEDVSSPCITQLGRLEITGVRVELIPS